MKRINKAQWYQGFITVISYSFILLFLYAATSKLIDYQKFAVQMGQSPMLTKYAGLLAWMVPVAEIVIAGMLVFEGFRLRGLLASFSIMTMFSTYIFIILNYAETIPCNCGGLLESMKWPEHMVFNVVFVVLAGIGIALQHIVISNRREKPFPPA